MKVQSQRNELDYPRTGKFRRCSKCHRLINILTTEFWRIDDKLFYHINCRNIVRFAS